MVNKFKFLTILVASTFLSTPVFSSGHEDISLFKIILQLIFYILIFVAVIFLTIYGTRLIAKNYNRFASSRYIDLLDVLNIPGGAKIVIAKINNNIYILSVSNNSTTVIDKIHEDEFSALEESFDNYLDKYMSKWNLNLKSNLSSNRFLSKFYLKKDKEDMQNETKD